MEDIVYEVIGGAIILGIILLIIVVFRNSAGVMRESANRQAQAEDISVEETIGVSGGVYKGAKIVEAYKFSQISDVSSDVWVKTGATRTKITQSNVDRYLSNGDKYELKIIYLSEETNATPETENSKIVREKGDVDIAFVRFLFKRQ